MDIKKITVISLTSLLSILCVLFFCPSVSAEVTEEQNFYHWYVVEKTTEDYVNHHGGGGSGGKKKFNAAEALATDYGCTTEDVIYNCTGLTRSDYEAFINEEYGNINAENLFTNAFFGTPVTASNSELYATSRANRVDSEGNINVSGSNFWRSVYNQMFSGGGYKDIYTETDGGYNIPKYNLNIIYYGLCERGSGGSTVPNSTVSPYLIGTSSGDNVFRTTYSLTQADGSTIVDSVINVNGYYLRVHGGRFVSGGIEDVYVSPSNSSVLVIHCYGVSAYEEYTYYNLNFSVDLVENDISHDTVPVKNPTQVGFIKYPLGQKTPVYTPDSGEENPFNINDNGTVSMDDDDDPTTDDTDYPVWVSPDELSDDGWKLLFKYVNDDDNADNPYNPYNRPWNTQDDGTILGGLFNNLIKDISSLFSNIANGLKDLLKGIFNIPKFIFDGLKNFFNGFFDLGDFDLFNIEIENNFNILQELYEHFLELMGVDV